MGRWLDLWEGIGVECVTVEWSRVRVLIQDTLFDTLLAFRSARFFPCFFCYVLWVSWACRDFVVYVCMVICIVVGVVVLHRIALCCIA
jgi:hypothetical protein